jgi:hypothetical protein
MRNVSLLIALFTAVALISGCGDGTIRTFNVTGTITFDGEPLSNASVTFTPVDEGNQAYGLTDANGRYVLQTRFGRPGAGTTPGNYAVHIVRQKDTQGRDPDSPGEPPPPESLIPERYTDPATSGFAATVEKGKRNVFDFNLEK